MSLQALKKDELVTLAEGLGLSTDGTKADLIERINAAQEAQDAVPEPEPVPDVVPEPKVKQAIVTKPGFVNVEYLGRGSFDAGGRVFSAVSGKIQKVPASMANRLVTRFPNKFKIV